MCTKFDFISICHYQGYEYQLIFFTLQFHDVKIVSFTQYGDILTISSTERHMALAMSPIICNNSINDVNKTRLQTEPRPLNLSVA